MLPDDTREAVSGLVKERQKTLEAKYGNSDENLRIVGKAIDSIAVCFELNHGTADEIAFPLTNMYQAIRKEDHNILDSNIQVLRNESNRSPQHIRLSVAAQIELLNACCKNIINYRLDLYGGKK